MRKFSENYLKGKPEMRGGQSRLNDSRTAHRLGGSRAGIAAYCAGNIHLIENAKGCGNL